MGDRDVAFVGADGERVVCEPPFPPLTAAVRGERAGYEPGALLGIGMGHGEDRAVEAARAATESPLLETSMEGARKILLSITGGTDLGLWEINEAAKTVSAAAHPDANIIFGAMVDEKLDDTVWVTVVATGYGPVAARPQRRRIEEPAGEPRVQRRAEPARSSSTQRTGLGVNELDVPEFIPRG